jgi:thiosulfate/3-mercaptopyruvate sulfurtransferase
MPSPREAMLAETAWLAARLDDPAIRIVDLRGSIRPPTVPPPWYAASRDACAAGHLRGAVCVDWLQDIVDPAAPVATTLARADEFAAVNYYGHPAVRVLNGGFGKWVVDGVAGGPPPGAAVLR